MKAMGLPRQYRHEDIEFGICRRCDKAFRWLLDGKSCGSTESNQSRGVCPDFVSAGFMVVTRERRED